MNITTVKSTIAGIITTESGLTPVWEYEYTTPTAPYIVLNITAIKIPHKDSKNYSGEGVLEILGTRDLSVSIRCYGSSGLQYLADLMICLTKPSNIETLAGSDIILTEIDDILDITPDLEDQTEPCAQMHILLRTHDTLTIQPTSGGYIETVHAEGDITY